ncbi:MAG: lipoyl(octanoyl) transferase LipB [Gammaproteobacteria bacterium]
MQAFTAARDEDQLDEFWVVEHPPVFTQGRNGKPEHILNPGDIPVVPIDRGGQVTYHGPGQLVIYTLIDLGRRKLGIRALVTAIENAIIKLLNAYGIESHARVDAPGVYVGDAKIAALGLRVSRGKSFHGLSLNVDMDLAPFSRINPCGYADLKVTQTSGLGITANREELALQLCENLAEQVGYAYQPSHNPLHEFPRISPT